MISEQNLPHLIKLLDDKEPTTQRALKKEFAHSSGDISNEMAALAIGLKAQDRAKLSALLQPGRKATLLQEWQIPEGGAAAIADDWDSFEHHLRIVSDYLHDGLTLRPPLPDMIDLIAKEAQDELPDINVEELRKWMFESGKYVGNKENYYLPQNSDICWVADTGLGNPISLATLYMLVGNRLHLEITGCNYPGHFLARIYEDGEALLIDCFHKGKKFSPKEILRDNKEISLAAKMAIQIDTPLGHILWRFLRNLEHSFNQLKQHEEAKLFDSLANSLH